jgi:hypothetical protein
MLQTVALAIKEFNGGSRCVLSIMLPSRNIGLCRMDGPLRRAA